MHDDSRRDAKLLVELAQGSGDNAPVADEQSDSSQFDELTSVSDVVKSQNNNAETEESSDDEQQ